MAILGLCFLGAVIGDRGQKAIQANDQGTAINCHSSFEKVDPVDGYECKLEKADKIKILWKRNDTHHDFRVETLTTEDAGYLAFGPAGEGTGMTGITAGILKRAGAEVTVYTMTGNAKPETPDSAPVIKFSKIVSAAPGKLGFDVSIPLNEVKGKEKFAWALGALTENEIAKHADADRAKETFDFSKPTTTASTSDAGAGGEPDTDGKNDEEKKKDDKSPSTTAMAEATAASSALLLMILMYFM